MPSTSTAHDVDRNVADVKPNRFTRWRSRKQVRYIARVESITVLGVSFTNTLNFSPHICNLTTKAARSLLH